jgi:competence protein ComEC
VLELAEQPPAARPHRVRVTTRAGTATVRAGDAVRLQVTLGPPGQPAAPGDFDFGRQAWFASLGGFGFAHGEPTILADPGVMPMDLHWQVPIERLREAIRARIIAALPGESGEIATALITGERGGISDETNQAYRDSGLFHMLSISGLHMVIMAGAVFWVLRLLLASVPAIALRYPIKRWAAAGAIIGALAYLLISGAAVATVRSYVMITIMFVAVIFDRPAIAMRNVALAAIVVLVFTPESLFDAGFQMSFAAAVGLVSFYETSRARRVARDRRRGAAPAGAFGGALRFVGDIVASTLVASAVVAPFAIYHFNQTQLLALLANVLAMPICNLLVMPAALAVLIALPLGLEVGPLTVMGGGIDVITAVAQVVGALPGAVVKVQSFSTPAFICIVGGGLWVLLWRAPWRFWGLVPILVGAFIWPPDARPDVLVGRDGVTVAVRAADGRLSALMARGAGFDLARWLDRDGDRRGSIERADARAFTCDALGCSARVREHHVAVVVNAAALRDDCGRADVLILRLQLPRPCPRDSRAGQVRIDPRQLARSGAHAVRFAAGGALVTTVAEARGDRPWSQSLVRPEPRDDGLPADARRLGGFGALFARFRSGRPEQVERTWPHRVPDEQAD